MKNNIILLNKEGLLHEAEFGFIQQPFFQILTVRTPHSRPRCGHSVCASGR